MGLGCVTSMAEGPVSTCHLAFVWAENRLVEAYLGK